MTVSIGIAVAGFLGFAWLVVFQLILSAGVPLGHMAWGGAQKVLDRRRRLASLASSGLALLGAVAMGQAAGWWQVLPQGFLVPLLVALGGLFALSLLGNALSSSRAERLHGVPLTLVLSGSCLVLALLH